MDEGLFKYRYRVLTFASFNETDFEFAFQGEYLHVQSTDGVVYLKLNSPSNDNIPLGAKDPIVAPFTRIYLSTLSAVTFTLFVSSDKNIRLESNEITIDTISKIEKTSTGSYGHKTVGATAELIDAADVDRKRLTIQNWSANPVFVGFDTSLTPANAGIRLAQYDAKDVDKYTGAVYAIAAGAGNDVAYMKEGG